MQLRLAVPGPTMPIVVGAIGLVAAGIAHISTPGRSALLPCPLFSTTGVHCPGCGATRALHALTHGDLVAALHNNILFVLALPLMFYAWLAWTANSRGSRRLPEPRFGARSSWAIAGVVITFFALRNVPGLEWMAPIPVG